MPSDGDQQHERAQTETPQAGEVLREQCEDIRDRFPAPLSHLLVEMAQRNYEHWLDGEDWRERTIGAESIREYGLTENQRTFANQIAEQMGVDHDAYQ